ETGPWGTYTLELEDVQRFAYALDARSAEIPQREVAADELRGVLGEIDAARLRKPLDARCQPHRVPLRGVVHAQVLADLADHHFARVDPHAHRKVEAPRHA